MNEPEGKKTTIRHYLVRASVIKKETLTPARPRLDGKTQERKRRGQAIGDKS